MAAWSLALGRRTEVFIPKEGAPRGGFAMAPNTSSARDLRLIGKPERILSLAAGEAAAAGGWRQHHQQSHEKPQDQ
jgi:hypothetical protein